MKQLYGSFLLALWAQGLTAGYVVHQAVSQVKIFPCAISRIIADYAGDLVYKKVRHFGPVDFSPDEYGVACSIDRLNIHCGKKYVVVGSIEQRTYVLDRDSLVVVESTDVSPYWMTTSYDDQLMLIGGFGVSLLQTSDWQCPSHMNIWFSYLGDIQLFSPTSNTLIRYYASCFTPKGWDKNPNCYSIGHFMRAINCKTGKTQRFTTVPTNIRAFAMTRGGDELAAIGITEIMFFDADTLDLQGKFDHHIPRNFFAVNGSRRNDEIIAEYSSQNKFLFPSGSIPRGSPREGVRGLPRGSCLF